MRNEPDALMLFAAGFGTRMGALTANRPKPMVAVAGKPLIDHALGLADAARVRRKVVNLHYLGDQIAAHLSARSDILLSWESPSILDTGGGLRAALPLLGSGPVFTLNSDSVWTGMNPLAQLRAGWDGQAMSSLLLLLPVDRALGHAGSGDFGLDGSGQIIRGKEYVYLGAQIIDPSGIEAITERSFSLNRLWDDHIAGQRAYGMVHQGGWCDVGHPDGIFSAEAMLTANSRDERGV